MKKKYRILVFPCGSEIGLEVYRSLRYSAHIELIGGNSIDDHGKFVYENYIPNIPFINSINIIQYLKKLVNEKQIDAIYPTMDKVIWKLKSYEDELGCKVISSPPETTEICLSKNETYKFFQNKIKVPKVYHSLEDIDNYPVFIKPDVGYGARNIFIAEDVKELDYFFYNKEKKDYIITEYLPGDEFTVDCFTDKYGKLRFAHARKRNRIKNGISVNTSPVDGEIKLFSEIAKVINASLKLRGAWFFQLKKNINDELVLLEVAARLGGSSALFRCQGTNFALLSVFDAFDINVDFIENNHRIELDRSLDVKYKMDFTYSTVYVDLDDCLIIDRRVNYDLIAFLYKSLNYGKNLILLTKHEDNIEETLNKYRLESIFDEIITISKDEEKSNYISIRDSIFIDDSFVERKNVLKNKNIPVFAPDMIESLL